MILLTSTALLRWHVRLKDSTVGFAGFVVSVLVFLVFFFKALRFVIWCLEVFL